MSVDFISDVRENLGLRRYVSVASFCGGVLTWWCDFRRTLRMSTPSRKRLMRDFKRLMQDPPAGISGAPQDNNIMLWNAVIFGYE